MRAGAPNAQPIEMPSPRDASTSSKLVNWHPKVHLRFGEKLYFYLLRLRQPLSEPVADHIRTIMQQADIEYACEYALFGYWDALIRVWLTEVSQHRLLFVLDRDTQITEVRHFEAEQVRYLWTDTDEDLLAVRGAIDADITANDADIRAVAETMTANGPVWDLPATQRLSGTELLIPSPGRTDGEVKFYWSLNRAGTGTSLDAETKTLLRAIHEVGVGDRASLYTGVGNFTSYLVRCVAPSYDGILAITSQLDQYLDELEVERTTFLIANQRARESDNINGAHYSGLTRDDVHDVTTDVLELGEIAIALLSGLPNPQRDALHRLITKAHEISRQDEALRGKLRTLLRACLENNRDAVTASLAFLLDTEYFLGDYLKRAWGSLYGEWMKHLAALFEGNAATTRYATAIREPDDWTLGSLIGMAEASAEADPKVDARLTSDLGPRWKTQLLRLREVRNRVAHGQVRREPRLDDFAGKWGDTLVCILEDIAPLQGTLQNLLQERSGN
jgi:hypothetical protein